jgi:TPR repeat protein
MGVPQSDVEAAKWYGKAAAGGYTKSIDSLKELFSSISSKLEEGDLSDLEQAEDPK